MPRRGQILLAILPLFAFAVGTVIVLINSGQFTFHVQDVDRLERDAATIADAGISRATACLQATDASTCGGRVGVNYTGENNLTIGAGTVTITVTTVDAQRRRVRATGTIPNTARARATASRTAELRIDVSPIGFAYGAQAGDGGVSMGNTAEIDGSAYSNGSILAENGAQITGDAFVAAGPPLTTAVSVDAAPSTITVGRTSPFIDIAQRFTIPTSGPLRTVSLYLKKVGAPPESKIRILLHDDARNQPSTDAVGRATLSTSRVGTSIGWVTVTYTTPPSLVAGRTYWLVLDASERTNDYWVVGINPSTSGSLATTDWGYRGWQDAGGTIAHRITIGGIDTKLDNVSVGHDARAHTMSRVRVNGSAWSTNLTDSTIGGTIQSGMITHSTIGGNAYGKTITTSTIGGNVWCETITSSTVGGRRYCPTAVTVPTDLIPAPFPITMDQITQWKSDAAAGGTTGTLHPTSGTITHVGPVRIEGDLTLDNNQTLIIDGTIHVTGNIRIGQNGSVILNTAYGPNSGMVVIDGTIDLENNGAMRGSGTSGSYLLLISLAMSNYDTNPAIDIHNSANGAMFYAPNGSARLHNTTTISQLTAHRITIDNGAILRYERGFLDARFTSGPTAGWSPILGTWRRE